MHFRAPGTLAMTLALAAWVGQLACAENALTLERRVKAAYLFKFGNYVEWPEGTFDRDDSPLRIGVAGDEAIAEELERTAARHTLGKRPVRVVRLRPGDAPGSVHILFVGRQAHGRNARLLTGAGRDPVLTVTESAERPPPPGIVIDLVVVDGRVRFEVFLEDAVRRNLKLGSALLAVARKVHGAG